MVKRGSILAVAESGCLRMDLAGAAQAVTAHPLLTATTTSVVTYAVTIDIDEVVTVAGAVGAVGALAVGTAGGAQVAETITIGVNKVVTDPVAVNVDKVVVDPETIDVDESPGITVAGLRLGTGEIAYSITGHGGNGCCCHGCNQKTNYEEETKSLFHDVVPFSNIYAISHTNVERPCRTCEAFMKRIRRSLDSDMARNAES
jgi:hypothetical protein